MKRLALIALLGLAACTNAVHLRHPDGRIAECSSRHNSTADAIRQSQCIEDYKDAGYVPQR